MKSFSQYIQLTIELQKLLHPKCIKNKNKYIKLYKMRTLTQFLTGNINEGRFEKNKKTLGLFFAWYFSSNAKSTKNWKNVDKKWAKEILSWDEDILPDGFKNDDDLLSYIDKHQNDKINLEEKSVGYGYDYTITNTNDNNRTIIIHADCSIDEDDSVNDY